MELDQKQIPYLNPVLQVSSQYEESADAIVPDSQPDILRLIASHAAVSLKEESLQEGRIVLSGAVTVSVLYQPEGTEGVRQVEVPIPFAHMEEERSITPAAKSRVTAQVARVDARVVNPRKIAVGVQIQL